MGVVEDYKIESWTLFGCGCMVVFFRLFARWRVVGFANFCLDDYLVVLALTFDAALNTLAHFMMQVGVTNSKIDLATREALTEAEKLQRATGSKIWMAGWCTYAAVVWTLKFCMVIFFNRVMNSLHRQNLIRWAFWITGISGICVFMVFWLTCTPTYKLFQSWPYPGARCESETPVFYISTLCFNVATDIYIISIPLPVLWSARLPPMRKFMILLLFGGGFFVIIAAILRCVLGLTSPEATTTAQWACRETFVAIVIGNAPMIKPLFSRTSWSISTGNSKPTGESSSNNPYPSQSNGTGGYEMNSRQSAKKKKAKTLMSITGDTVFASDSQEKIIVDNESEMGLHREVGGGREGDIESRGSDNSGSTEGKSARGMGGPLRIVADTSYTISSSPAVVSGGERKERFSPGSPTGSEVGRLRPEKASYAVMVEGGETGRRAS